MTVNPALHGARVFLLAPALACGCGGIDGGDVDDQGRFTWALLGADAPERIESIRETWEGLWPDSPGAQARLAEMGVKVTGPADPGRGPRWDASWRGTLGGYWAAVRRHEDQARAHRQALGAALQRARASVLEGIGATPVRGDWSTVFYLVHDVGCRCGHSNADFGDGWTRIDVVGDVAYAHDGSVNIDELLAAADVAAQRAAEHAREQAARLTVERFADLRTPLFSPNSAEADLTYAQWHAARTERAQQVLADIQAGRVITDPQFAHYRVASPPHLAAEYARSAHMTRYGLQLLTAEQVADLEALLT